MEVLIIIWAQILAIYVHANLLWLEKKYCGHCDWWWNTGAVIFIVMSFIPVLGLFTSIAWCVTYTRNIIEELIKKNKEKEEEHYDA